MPPPAWSGQPQRAEEMHRPGQIPEQKPDGDDIEQDAEGAPQAIVGIAGRAQGVADGNLGDARAIETGQRRNEAVQFAVEMDIFQHLGAIGLEGGAEIAQLHAGGLGHQPIGDARGNLAQQRVVHAVLPPAAGDIVSLFDFFEQRGNVLRRVLQVAIHRDDDLALRFVKPAESAAVCRNCGAAGSP